MFNPSLHATCSWGALWDNQCDGWAPVWHHQDQDAGSVRLRVDQHVQDIDEDAQDAGCHRTLQVNVWSIKEGGTQRNIQSLKFWQKLDRFRLFVYMFSFCVCVFCGACQTILTMYILYPFPYHNAERLLREMIREHFFVQEFPPPPLQYTEYALVLVCFWRNNIWNLETYWLWTLLSWMYFMNL